MTQFEKLQEKVIDASTRTDPVDFFCHFLLAYEIPKATLVRLGITEGIAEGTGVSITNKLFFVYSKSENLYAKFDFVQRELVKNKPYRFIMLSNGCEILALDTKNGEWLSVKHNQLYKEAQFFYPLMGIEATNIAERKTASVQIGELFASFYNTMALLNPDKHTDLNNLIVSLVTVFLSDSCGLIETGSMHKWLTLHCQTNGDGLDELVVNTLNALSGESVRVPEYITSKITNTITGAYAYAGGLTFNADAREILMGIAELDWADIEPEVLGALIQSIVTPGENSATYNYTTTANVYKVIGPLFIDGLYEKYESLRKNSNLSPAFLDELEKIVILDPACGTGNFLLVAYRELKKLELHTKEYFEKNSTPYNHREYVRIENFFGIETSATAASITKIGLAFTELRLNPKDPSPITLNNNRIFVGDALQIDWKQLLPKDHVVYIIGNPPYKGNRGQSDAQRAGMAHVFADAINEGLKIGDLDYASGFFYKAAQFVRGTQNGFAFVTTNSLTQGVHVPTLWPAIHNLDVVISFAHTSFKWKNEGRNVTAVTVVIIGCRSKDSEHKKTLYSNNMVYDADDISPYLTKGNAIVEKENRGPISKWLPKMIKGNMPYGKGLLLEPNEKDELLSLYPESGKFLRRVIGSEEYIHSKERWCLWISDDMLEAAMEIPLIAERIESVREARLQGDPSAKRLATRAHQFRETNMPNRFTLVVPSVSSENRAYFQVGFVNRNVVVTNLAFVIYDAEPWVFGIISSKLHNLWIRTVCGGLETRPRYSNVLGYNTFPLPKLSDAQKARITQAALNVIAEREKHSEKTLMELYNQDTMPDGLKYAHSVLDLAVEECYNPEGFCNDQERLNALFLLYKEIKGV